MFSENVDYVLLYRDHRTVAKAPTQVVMGATLGTPNF